MSQIVHNSGTNFSLYYNVLNYFKTIMSNHPSISEVTQGDITKIDVDQFPAYPIGNINITESNFGTNITNYTIELTVADKIKNKNNESSGSINAQTIPFYGVDDVVDIHANTLGIINDLTSYTQRGVQGFDINDDITCVAFAEEYNNGLAGTTPNSSRDITTYYDYKCYTIVDTFTNNDEYNFVNLPILALPYTDFENCAVCDLWTNPQVWGTTPQNWSSGPDVAYRVWQFD